MRAVFDCPGCGASVPFTAPATIFAVCGFCHSTVVRHDRDVELIGKAADLPPDLSPLRVGARGRIDGLEFSVIGRIRRGWDGGSWNEWCTLFPGDRYVWIAEAQGGWFLSEEIPDDASLPVNPRDMISGLKLRLDSKEYEVTDVKETECLGVEGELPHPVAAGDRATSVDLAGAGGAFASIEYEDGERSCFTGREVGWDDLNIADGRPVPGWSPDAPPLPERTDRGSLACPSCGAAVTIRVPGRTMSATCGSCGTLLDTSHRDWRIAQTAMERRTIEPFIPLGSHGKLAGREWEVVGFQTRKDPWSEWEEYLLFNPWHGYAWLSQFRGHWNFITRLFQPASFGAGAALKVPSTATWEGRDYAIYAFERAEVTYVLGEFYWQVRTGEEAWVSDFIRPPFMLSRETYPGFNETTWSRGTYLEPAALRAAFPSLPAPPAPDGVGANQPNPHDGYFTRVVLPWIACLVLLIAIDFIGRAMHRNEVVYEGPLVHAPGATGTVAVTPPIHLPGGHQAIRVVTSAPVDNSWMEAEYDLVNTNTQETISFASEVARYSGYDDGYWSEGSQTREEVIPFVKGGTYQLAAATSADPAAGPLRGSVRVIRDVHVASNFWLCVALVSVYPLWKMLRHHAFERARWAASDYSPYGSSESSSEDDE